MAVAKIKTDQDLGRLLQHGAALHNAGDSAGAERAYLDVLKKRARDPDALHLLGVLYGQRGDALAGLSQIKKALSVRDDFPDAHLNAGKMALQLRDWATAEHHARRALQFRPAWPAGYCNLGVILREQSKMAEAVEAFHTALQFDPAFLDSHIELMRTFRITGDLPRLLQATEAGSKVAPQHPTFHIAASQAHFVLGDLRRGWQGYAWRFQSVENRVEAKAYALPTWRGEDLAGRSILIWGEQAPGDEILYANMFAEVIAQARRCVIQCAPRLAPLFRRSFPNAEIVDRDLSIDELRDIDFQTPAGNLGAWLRPDIERFPKHTGYLKADAAARDTLRAKYGTENLLVGIAWRSAATENGTDKTVNILEWGPIFHVPGVTFVNLQYGDCRAELETIAKGFGKSVIQDAAIDPLKDMDAYAAQVAAMDVVISSSNTAAHVAGALGVPTLCMLPISLGRGRHWYWFADRDRCAWYPSVRLFTQRHDRQWLDILRDVGLALADAVAARGTSIVPYLRSLGTALAGMKPASKAEALQRKDDAEAFFQRLAHEPGAAAEAHTRIGDLRRTYDPAGAVAEYDLALVADPTWLSAHNGKGMALADLHRFKEAIDAYQRGLEHHPRSPELHANIGTALGRLGRSTEAVQSLKQALEILPVDSPVRDPVELNLALGLEDAGDREVSLKAFDHLLTRSPEHVEAHHARSQLLLSRGEFREGWAESAWRLKRLAANVRYDQLPHAPRWNGEDISGKNVVIWTEQGIGDEILAASMVPDAIAVAKHVTLLCSERLLPLFRRSFPRATVDERKEPLPKSAYNPRPHFQMSVGDLGAAFRPDFASFPPGKAFLCADDERRAALRAKYEAVNPGAKIVGLAWSSLKNHEIGWLKGPAFAAFEPILKTPNVTFVNLQYGDRSSELAWARDHLGVSIVDDKSVDALQDMDAFAAQVAAMDLVISTSNTAVHTAAALGTPTWVLLAKGRGRLWYWFHDRTDSPWYASVRLFSQKLSGDWSDAIEACAASFQNWCATQTKSETL